MEASYNNKNHVILIHVRELKYMSHTNRQHFDTLNDEASSNHQNKVCSSDWPKLVNQNKGKNTQSPLKTMRTVSFGSWLPETEFAMLALHLLYHQVHLFTGKSYLLI